MDFLVENIRFWTKTQCKFYKVAQNSDVVVVYKSKDNIVKAHSHQTKTIAKENIFFDVYCVFSDLFRFRLM